MHYELCQHLDYEFFEAGKTVFDIGIILSLISINLLIGSYGTNFYIILAGSVDVLIQAPIKDENGQMILSLQKFAEFNTGDYFGESAIMDPMIRPRSTTIICKENCHILMLDRVPYNEFLGEKHRQDLDKTIEFLMVNPLFRPWNAKTLRTWAYLFKMEHKYNRNAVLYKEGDIPEDVFIIKSGRVVCTKVIAIHKRQKEDRSLCVDEEDQVIAVAKASTTKALEIATYGPGEMFGEEECYYAYRHERESPIIIKESPNKNKKSHKKEGDIIMTTENDGEALTRETTMSVMSSSAEIWKIPAKVINISEIMSLSYICSYYF